MADSEIHARLVIHDFDTMSEEDAARLADWLIDKAHEINSAVGHKTRTDYASKYTSRLFK